jgi:hypothetical protein
MSRTLKDRPDWVKVNHKAARLVEVHHHQLLGQPTTRYRNVMDLGTKYVTGYYPDVCTVDEPVSSDWDQRGIPCRRFVDYDHLNRPASDERHQYHRSARSREKAALRHTARTYASMDEETWDEGHPELTARTRFHNGRWH